MKRAAPRPLRRAYREPRRLSGYEHCLAGDLPLRQILQVFLFDLEKEAVICAGITGLRDREKFAAVPLVIISGTEVGPKVQRPEPPHVLRFDLPGRLSSRRVPFDIAVDVLSVQCRDTCCIVRALHPSLYFERVDAGVDQVRQDLQDAHIPHGQGISQFTACPGRAPGILPRRERNAPAGSVPAFPLLRRHVPVCALWPLALLRRYAPGTPGTGRFQKRHIVPAAVQDPVGEPAGSGASSAVPAAAAQKARHEAAPRVGVTHRAVDKALDLYGLLLLEDPDLLEGQFPGRHDPFHAEPLEKAHGFRPRDRHLRRRVERKARAPLMEPGQNTDVLHDRSVQPLFVQVLRETDSLLQFALFCEDIERQVHFFAENMGLPDGSDDVFPGKVLRVRPRAEFLAAQIHGVRTCFHRAEKSLPASGRREEFRQPGAPGTYSIR